MTTAHSDHLVDILVGDSDGDEETIRVNANNPLSVLLQKGLKALHPHEGLNPGDYDLVINGTVQENLDVKVGDAGLHDGSDVSIQSKDVSRG